MMKLPTVLLEYHLDEKKGSNSTRNTFIIEKEKTLLKMRLHISDKAITLNVFLNYSIFKLLITIKLSNFSTFQIILTRIAYQKTKKFN